MDRGKDSILEQIPAVTRERLLQLMRILEGAGSEHLSSARIEELTGWSSNTVRRDISYLESFAGGPPDERRLGSVNGYAPACLVPLIRRALSLDKRRRYCVVGLGRLGSAYLNSGGPAGSSPEFELTAGFDISVNRVEILKSPAPLYPAYKLGEVIARFGIEIALLCVPAEAAQAAAEKLAAAGIRGILNFAPVALMLPPQVAVRNVYLEEELRALAIRM
ncbi:MAG: CoA-binding protein [Treponema sp.]|nr:CoA-binding protein [Treponema sp.]